MGVRMLRVLTDESSNAASAERDGVCTSGWFTNCAQRAMDLVIAVSAMAILSPLLLATWLLVKLTSRGPAFYVQERVGRGGVSFPMLKFRTMRADAEHSTGPVWAIDHDPRCTSIGKWLRRLSIDELPQLVNVLRGEMSIVGPRPERPYFVERFSLEYPEYGQRHAVRPGLTGWAQIHGWRGNTSLVERLRCDLDYVRRQSVALDIYIIAMTPYVVFSGGKVREVDTGRDDSSSHNPGVRDAA
jgi:exopolysaccharide biosynthesis polyprenyl glycosylphosphotransferase